MISNVINNLIGDSSDFCHICLNKSVGLTLQLQDKCLLGTTEFSDDLQYDDVFCLLLGEELTEKLKCFETVCKSCADEALKCYKFILNAQENLNNIINNIESLYKIINNLNANKLNFKSVFIDLVSENHHYDTTSYNNNKTHAIKRLLKIKKQNLRRKDIQNDTKLLRCQKCSELFCNKKTLQDHFKNCTTDLNPHQCIDCTELFETEDSLKEHNVTYHSNVTCTICGKIYESREALDRHEISHKKSLMCHNCGRVYKTNITFKKHIDLNICSRATATPSQGTFICDYCGKRYTQKMSLRVHVQYEHLNYKAHECKVCNKKFWAQSRLKYHMVKHTKEKKYPCNVCGGKFVTKESLLYHTRIHTGERPYECRDCGEQFLSASRRLVHYRKVHLQKTFPCNDCNIMFPSQYKLTKHMQYKHF